MLLDNIFMIRNLLKKKMEVIEEMCVPDSSIGFQEKRHHMELLEQLEVPVQYNRIKKNVKKKTNIFQNFIGYRNLDQIRMK